MARYMVKDSYLNMRRDTNHADAFDSVLVADPHPEDVTEHVPATMSGILLEARIQGFTRNYAHTGQVTKAMTIGKI